MKFVRGALGLVLGLALPLAVAGAATIHVPGDYLTIQEAVDAAAYGDEILVAPGSTYASPTREAGAGDTTLCSVILKSGIKLRGSGAGQTFIHGDSVGRVLHLYQCEDVEISDLTVTEGFAEYFGSGIFCRQSSPYIHDVEVEGNWDGGISMIEGSHPVIENCVMDNNEAKAGGGLAVEATCHPYLYDCRITNNRAPFAGGAIVRSDATLYNCTISGNRTSGSVNVLGGGILVVDIAEPVIIGCEISNNECFGNGGGIAFIGEGCGGLLLGCTVTGNVSTGLEGHGGGISVTSGANPEIRKCVVADNYTTGQWSDCGGMYVEYAGVNASDCTFYGNWTEGDGAEAGNISLVTSMFVESTMSVARSIIAFSPEDRGLYCTGTGDPPDISCCCVYGNAGGDEICETSGTGNFSLDPLLCSPATGDYFVAANSPCAPGNHPEGPGACGGLLIGARMAGCDTAVEDPELAPRARLLGNRPNPFSGATAISFVLPSAQKATLEVCDPTGRRVALLHDGWLPAGPQQIAWDGTTLRGAPAPSGVYFYRLRSGGTTEGRPMLHLR